MSDFEIRRLERKYRESGSIQDADRLINALMHTTGTGGDPDFPDMEVCYYWLGELPGFDDDSVDYSQSDEFTYITDWISNHASFATTREYQWEFMVYIAKLDDEEERLADDDDDNYIVEAYRRWEEDPMPALLIPIVRRAARRGIAYLNFHIEF